jgi:hypothetical protein
VGGVAEQGGPGPGLAPPRRPDHPAAAATPLPPPARAAHRAGPRRRRGHRRARAQGARPRRPPRPRRLDRHGGGSRPVASAPAPAHDRRRQDGGRLLSLPMPSRPSSSRSCSPGDIPASPPTSATPSLRPTRGVSKTPPPTSSEAPSRSERSSTSTAARPFSTAPAWTPPSAATGSVSDQKLVTFGSTKVTSNFEAMDPLEWLARMSDHIPDPGPQHARGGQAAPAGTGARPCRRARRRPGRAGRMGADRSPPPTRTPRLRPPTPSRPAGMPGPRGARPQGILLSYRRASCFSSSCHPSTTASCWSELSRSPTRCTMTKRRPSLVTS